jgi:hypothetical protein
MLGRGNARNGINVTHFRHLLTYHLLMKDKEYFLKELNRRGYDNPKLSDLNEKALKEILKNEESFYKRNSS